MGFEPMRIAPTDLETVSLTTRTSSLLGVFRENYQTLLRSAGIEHAYLHWKCSILPLNYERFVQAPFNR